MTTSEVNPTEKKKRTRKPPPPFDIFCEDDQTDGMIMVDSEFDTAGMSAEQVQKQILERIASGSMPEGRYHVVRIHRSFTAKTETVKRVTLT